MDEALIAITFRALKRLQVDSPDGLFIDRLLSGIDNLQMGLVQVIFEHMQSGFTEIVANLGVLFILAWTITLVDKTVLGFDRTSQNVEKALVGLIFGFAAMLGLGIPVKLEPGILAGAEGIPLFFSGYLSGPLAAVVCASITMLSRLGIGGPGLYSGLAAIVTFSCFGVISYYRRTSFIDKNKLNWTWPVGMTLVATAFAAFSVFLLPDDKQFAALWVIWPNLTIANGIGAFLLIKLLQRERAISQIENREEKAKAQRDKRIQAMIKNSPGMVYQYVLQPDGQHYMSLASEQGLNIYEISREDFEDNPQIFTDLVHSEDKTILNEKILKSAHQLTTFEWQGRIQTKLGKLKWITAKSVPQKLSNGDILWDGMIMDITKEKKLQTDLEAQRTLSAHRDKLASIGELAAGVGHEINNPLAVVLGNLELVLSREGFDEKSRPRLESATKAGKRIRSIVRNLRTFSRSDKDENMVFCAKMMLLELQSLVKEIYRHQGIDIRFDIELSDHTKIKGSPGKIQQALMNLLSNAKDATEGQELRNVTLTARNSKEYLQIYLTDNGPGIRDDIKERAFETFFTTKSPGKGTGLGLSLSQRFVAEFNGELQLMSTGEEGSCFRITIPLCKESLSFQKEQRDPKDWFPIPHSKGPLKVLIAEDVEDMRIVLAEMLKTSSVDLHTAENGLLAYQKITCARKPFDLVITDINMPEMSGLDLIESVNAANLVRAPKFIVITGGGQPQFQDLEKQKSIEVLMKPFSLPKLKTAIAAVLAADKNQPPPTLGA